MDQLSLIMEVCGLPPDDLLEKCIYKDEYFTENNIPKYIDIANYCPGAPIPVGFSTLGKPRMEPGTHDIRIFLGDNDKNLIDFIMQCLNWHPHRRISAIQALNHPWLKESLTEPMFTKKCHLPKRVQRLFTGSEKKIFKRYRKPTTNALVLHPRPKRSRSATTIKTTIPVLPVLQSLSLD